MQGHQEVVKMFISSNLYKHPTLPVVQNFKCLLLQLPDGKCSVDLSLLPNKFTVLRK